MTFLAQVMVLHDGLWFVSGLHHKQKSDVYHLFATVIAEPTAARGVEVRLRVVGAAFDVGLSCSPVSADDGEPLGRPDRLLSFSGARPVKVDTFASAGDNGRLKIVCTVAESAGGKVHARLSPQLVTRCPSVEVLTPTETGTTANYDRSGGSL